MVALICNSRSRALTKPAHQCTVHRDTVAAYLSLLNQVRDIANIEEPVSLAHLLTFPDIIKSLDDSAEANEALLGSG